MSFRTSKLYTVIFTFIYSFVFIFLLAIIYSFTEGKIDANKTLFQKKGLLDALNIKFNNDNEVGEVYDRNIKTKTVEKTTIYYTEENGKKKYAIIFSGVGLWSTITGVLAMNSDLTRIAGIGIISHSETPGLGGRIEETWFKEQFRNKLIINDQVISYHGPGTGDYNADDGKVDAITGATQTSSLFQIIINKYIPVLRKLAKEGFR